ncbi:Crossover junction endodeoxyribonuclease RuvC [Rosistilla ulvae]|uniref:Crossover junction endodeoxyribonuclease RuvC n=1 Tax=Rosistilla ulvae TaxID=1930277 RepID=A0A517LVR5_9BACT|nr:crossover junction endodeoxyribonuclease RuvC [Rosistilla ulvae]QDS86709.1 Crossover junction endodeoxyribonuclease RuvC [Rosistilla ulvae]
MGNAKVKGKVAAGGSTGGAILGVDPGLNITGYGVIRSTAAGIELLEAGIIRTKAKASLERRLLDLHEGLGEVIAAHKPSVLALEQLYSHYKRPQTAILMGHARGVICLLAAQAGIAIESFEATRVKRMMTGNGHAPKDQMQMAVKLQLNLATVPEPPDVADALAIALCQQQMSSMQVQL